MATIDQIKKKMQAMKTEKENATDLADQAEEKTKVAQQKLLKVTYRELAKSRTFIYRLKFFNNKSTFKS